MRYKYTTKPKEQTKCVSTGGGAVLVWAVVSIDPPRYDDDGMDPCWIAVNDRQGPGMLVGEYLTQYVRTRLL